MSLGMFNHVIQLIALAIIAIPALLAQHWARIRLRQTEENSEQHRAKDKVMELRAAVAEDAVATVIVELESHPATYATFPPDVRDKLYAAHEKTMQIRNRT